MMTSTQDLLAYLPHRPPMVWIDEVGETSPSGGECFVTLKSDGLYFSDGILRRTSLIEFLAQGFGYQTVAHKLRAGERPAAVARAFLVSVSKCHLAPTESLKQGDRLRVVFEDIKTVGPITLFNGKIIGTEGQEFCKASLKVFAEA
jgi:predicted hotdog family 3-hydroxylacyl-ACP dehydratase